MCKKMLLEQKLKEAADDAQRKANAEPNQTSYNAAWLHGYASALHDVQRELNKDGGCKEGICPVCGGNENEEPVKQKGAKIAQKGGNSQ